MRLFVAVWPPSSVVEAIRALDRPTLAGVRWTDEAQWHVTLRFLGEVADEEAPAVAEALGRVVGAGPVDAVVGPATGSFRGQVLHVPVRGLEGLAAAVVDATGGFGRPPERRPFRAHLTLARSKGFDLRQLAGVAVAAEWPVEEVTLVRSRLSSKGADYSVIASAALPR